MDCNLAISPDLGVSAVEFITAWNQDPQSSRIARATVSETAIEDYGPIDPEMLRQGLVFLAGVASTIALDVLKDIIKDHVTKLLKDRFGSKVLPPINVIVINTKDKPLIAVKQV